MKILLTGATSFTGAHIARAFADVGFEVAASLTQRMVHYSDPLVQRRREHARVKEWVEEAPFGSRRFLDFVRANKIDVFVNHGASIKGYREANFDYVASVRASLDGLQPVLDALAQSGCERLIHSGSIFEPDEGEAGLEAAPSAEAVSIYGVSKSMVWQALRFFSVKARMAVSKIIIPNPIGAFENEDRLIPFFVKTWRSAKIPSVRTPQLVRDNVPAPWLARFYVEEARRLKSSGPVNIRRPSAYALTNEGFLKLFIRRMEPFAKRALPFEINQKDVDEPLRRVNTEPAPELLREDQERKFWEDWAVSLGKW